MNWGYKITIVIVVFIFGMLGMVFIAFQQTNEMVDANYYEKELKYQNLIDASNNLSNASSDTLIRQNADGLIVLIPKNLLTSFDKGSLEFLRSSDQSKDLNLSFAPDPNGLFFIDRAKFASGVYKARIKWDSQGKTYYKEQTVFIN